MFTIALAVVPRHKAFMSSLSGLRVLIVEDEPIVAMLAEDMLDAIGCVVAASVATVADAQAAISSLSFDIAMVDLNLDGDDGLLVAATLNERHIPCLITTGYDGQGAANGQPTATVLTKPYSLADLEAALVRCVARA